MARENADRTSVLSAAPASRGNRLLGRARKRGFDRRRVAIAGATALFAILLSVSVHAGPADRTPTGDFKQLMVAAIDSPTGEAHGTLVGPMARTLTEQLHASGPILIDVSTERRYRQEGCRRLKVTFSQEGVQLPGQPEPRRQSLDLGINYCRDGTAPRSLL